jgi:GTPase SAR1 family protein
VSISHLCVAVYGVEIIHAGASGTGRTTFVNTLCESDVLQHKEPDSPDEAHLETGIRIKPANVGLCQFHHVATVSLNLFSELEEDGIRIALTVVDTPGFGDNIDNAHSFVFTSASFYFYIHLEIYPGSRKLSTTLNVNTTISLQNNRALNVTLVSATTEFMPFSTSFLQPVMRKQ